MTEKELRKILLNSGIELLKHNLVQGTWGNTSVRIDDEYMLVTPSGRDYLSIDEEDMAKVNIYTLEWSGKLKPTSERGIHAEIYKMNREINAVIHSHPTYCSVLASARVPLPAMSEHMEELLGGEVKVAGYGLPGTKKLRANTVKAMIDRKGCLMANHGVLCAGKDMQEAFEIIKTMEEGAKLYIEKTFFEITGKEFTHANLEKYFINL